MNKNMTIDKTLYNLVCFFVLLSFVLIVTPCFSEENASQKIKKALDPVTLQLKWKHQFQFAGYYAALEKGFYQQAGLDVKIVEAAHGEQSTRQVLNGNADFGIAMSDLIQHRANKEPVVALAAIFQHSPSIILAPKNNRLESIHDLKGKKVSLEAHSEQLLSYLESEGIQSNELILYPHDYDINKLISGEVDAISAYSTDEPFLLRQKGIEYSTFSPRAAGIDFYGDILFTSESQINEHPERVAAFLEASLEGWAYALSNPDEIIELILSKYSTRHSREHLSFEARMTKRLIMEEVVELGYMNHGRWKYIANSFKDIKLIPGDFSLDGFIYDRNPGQDLRWFYLSFIGVIAICGLAFSLVWKFHKLNTSLKLEVNERIKIIDQLKEANDQIKTLSGIIPICMHCKGIRDDKGYWNKLEKYMSKHSDAQFSHSVCDQCMEKFYPEESD